MFVIEAGCPSSTSPGWYRIAEYGNRDEAVAQFLWFSQRNQFDPWKQYRLLEVIDLSTEEKS